MKKRALFIASTGQHVGKTTTCLGLIAGFKKRLGQIGFMKPVGQEHVEVEPGVHADKDVSLFKEHFALPEKYAHMSPVLIPRGFTRDFLDGKHDTNILEGQIVEAFDAIAQRHPLTIVEGTGHVGVGSIVEMNNARVAKLLGLDMVLVASGGLGSSFDALAINLAMCEAVGVRVRGVILNRVYEKKRDMILEYMGKALKRWDLPILGCIPYDSMLSSNSMEDYEMLFKSPLLTGEEFHFRRFKEQRLIATSLERFREIIAPRELYITPATREDIIYQVLKAHLKLKIENPNSDLSAGLILTGDRAPSRELLEQLKVAKIPMLYTPTDSFRAMERIASFTAKFRKEDVEKVQEAIDVVEAHVDFDRILSLL